MDISFKIDGGHGDLIVETEGEAHNFGYNYTLKLPIALWLADKQVHGKNLFDGLNITVLNENSLNEEDGKLLRGAIGLGYHLPNSLDGFNRELALAGFSRWNNGSNSISYEALLRQEGLRFTRMGRRRGTPEWMFTISPADFRGVVESYLNFTIGNEELGRYKEVIPAAMRVLQIAR